VFTFQALISIWLVALPHLLRRRRRSAGRRPAVVLFKFKRTNNRELPLILGQLPVLPKHFRATQDVSSVGNKTAGQRPQIRSLRS
jgi:microcin C transport system substrate-binding protein